MTDHNSGMTAVVVLFSGLLAGLLLQPAETGAFGDTGVVSVLLSSGGGVALAVIAAASIAMVVRKQMVLSALSIGGAVLAGASALMFPSNLVAVVTGGLVLGCAATQANTRLLQALMIASFLVGLLNAGAVEALAYRELPQRYADYLTEYDVGLPVVVPVLCVLVATAWAARIGHGADTPPPDRDIRTIAAVVLIAVGGLLLDGVFLHGVFEGAFGFDSPWYLGFLTVPVLFAAAALMPGRGGMPVLAGAAVVLTSTTTAWVGIDVSDGVWTVGLVTLTAVSVAAGTALGLRWGHSTVGIVVLAAICATAVLDRAPWDNVNYAASMVAFPAAAAYLYVSCAPAGAPPLTLGLTVPVAITIPTVLTYGWTAYTPLTSVDTSTLSPNTDLWLATGAAVTAVLLAGLGIGAIDRYRALGETTGNT